jgi:hypothetical protein
MGFGGNLLLFKVVSGGDTGSKDREVTYAHSQDESYASAFLVLFLARLKKDVDCDCLERGKEGQIVMILMISQGS